MLKIRNKNKTEEKRTQKISLILLVSNLHFHLTLQFDDSAKFSLLKLFSSPPEFFVIRSHVSFAFEKVEFDTRMPVARREREKSNHRDNTENNLNSFLFQFCFLTCFEHE